MSPFPYVKLYEYDEKIGVELARELVAKIIADRTLSNPPDDNDCITFRGLIVRRYRPYGFYYIPGIGRVSTHILGLYARSGLVYVAGYHVSHLCANSLCFNEDHLVYEDEVINQSRKRCPRRTKCDCGNIRSLCFHSPPCVKAPNCSSCCAREIRKKTAPF